MVFTDRAIANVSTVCVPLVEEGHKVNEKCKVGGYNATLMFTLGYFGICLFGSLLICAVVALFSKEPKQLFKRVFFEV